MMPAVTTDDNFRQNCFCLQVQGKLKLPVLVLPVLPQVLPLLDLILLTQSYKAVIIPVKISEFFIEFQNVVFPALC